MPLFQTGHFANFAAFQREAQIRNTGNQLLPQAQPGLRATQATRDVWNNCDTAFTQLNVQNFAVGLDRLEALKSAVTALGRNPNDNSVNSFKHKILAYAIQAEQAARTDLGNIGGPNPLVGHWNARPPRYDAIHQILSPVVAGFAHAPGAANEAVRRYRFLARDVLVAVNQQITIAAQGLLDNLDPAATGAAYNTLANDDDRHAYLIAHPALGHAPTATQTELARLVAAELGRVNARRHIRTTVPLSADPSPNPIDLIKQLEVAKQAFVADRTAAAVLNTPQAQADYEAALKVQEAKVTPAIVVAYLATQTIDATTRSKVDPNLRVQAAKQGGLRKK